MQTSDKKQGDTLVVRTETPAGLTSTTTVQAFAIQPRPESAWDLPLDPEMSSVVLNTRNFSLPMEEDESLSIEYHPADKFAVVGGFNSYKYAQHRNQKHLNFNAQIIENPSNYPGKLTFASMICLPLPVIGLTTLSR